MLAVLNWYAAVMLTLSALLFGVAGSQKLMELSRGLRRSRASTRRPAVVLERHGARGAAQA